MWTLQKPKSAPVAFPPLVTFANVFTPTECKEIIRLGQEVFPRESGALENQNSPQAVRKCHVSWFNTELSTTQWIYQRLNDGISMVNQHNWQFDLDNIEPLQFTMYDQLADNYNSHIDMLNNPNETFRKLSFSVQLTAEDLYEDCDLQLFIGPEPIAAPRGQGSVTFFPSMLLHCVTPITRGQRYSLVGWAAGPQLR